MAKKILVLWSKLTQVKFFLLYAFILFGFLLLRDPFSQRTLIPNFEPYPDTIHYVTSARSFLSGQGLKITREGKGFSPNVPPLYSLVLVPFFAIYNDPRFFYLANVLLSFLSLSVFYLILRKITPNKWIIGLSLLLYVTNYFLYWYPSLAMAENLTFPLFLAGILLLISKITTKNIVLAGGLAVSFYAAKYVNAPMSLFYSLLYGGKIMVEKIKWKRKFRKSFLFLLSLIFFITLIFAYEYSKQGINPLAGLFGFSADLKTGTAAASSWFSKEYFYTNFSQYLSVLKGAPMRFLWDFTPIVPPWLAIMSLIGLFVGLVKKKFRLVSTALLVMLFGQMFFVSTFYAADARYIFHAIPTLLLGFVFFLTFASSLFKKIKLEKLFYVFLLGLFVFYSATNAIRIKSQVSLNLKYAEVPWYYISVLKLNEYFTEDKIVDGEKPVVISSMVPHFIDFYSNGNYELLPLSDQQAFWRQRNIVWGENDYSDLVDLYKRYLREGRQLYIAKYGLGNENYLHAVFNEVENRFKLTEVASGCFDLCNIYKVE